MKNGMKLLIQEKIFPQNEKTDEPETSPPAFPWVIDIIKPFRFHEQF
jgi:hypothetical protein